MLKTKVTTFTLLIILTFAALSTVLFANGQNNQTLEENIVTLAKQAADQIQTLITSVYTDENATARIENASFTEQFDTNVTLYQTEGLDKLTIAQEALANSNYDVASDSAIEALSIFRQVYASLKSILEAADLQDNSIIDNQELLDTINRELQRLYSLQNLLPEDTPQEITSLLSDTNDSLLLAKAAIQYGKYDEAKTLYYEVRQNITQIYQYLKTQAEESNTWRLSGYCERLQERIQERFRYGSDNDVSFTSTLKSLGYQSESQFMQALQSKIQNAQSQSDIQSAIRESLLIGQMVQSMEQALNQEINRQQQGQNKTTNGDNGTGGTTGENNTSSSDYSNSTGNYNGGSSNSSHSGTGNGGNS
jgi:hypothetical protein